MGIKQIKTQTINTNRLTLRRFTREDAPDMFRNWVNDADVCRYLSWEPHGDIENTKAIVNSWLIAYEQADNYNWAIALKSTNEVIGSIAVIDFNEKHKNCEVGYCIGQAYWQKGITTEALEAVMKFLFEEVGLNRIQAKHDVQNIASGKVMQKVGMQMEGTLRELRMRKDGSFADYNLWAILRET